MRQVLAGCWTDDSGQDVAEYAILLTLLLVVTAAVIKSIGTTSNSIFADAVNKLKGN